MPFQPPPAHVQELSIEDMRLLSGAHGVVDSSKGQCVKELSELLSLSVKASASSTVLQAGEDLALKFSKVLNQRDALAQQSAPIGRNVGEFSYGDGVAQFTLTTNLSVDLLACKVLGLYDPSGLSAEMVSSLIDANRVKSPELQNQLILLKNSIVDPLQSRNFSELPKGTVITAPKEVQALLLEEKTRSALFIVQDLQRISEARAQKIEVPGNSLHYKDDTSIQLEDLPSQERLSEMSQKLEKGLILSKASVCAHRANMDASRFLAKSTNSVLVFTPKSEREITEKFKDFFTFQNELSEAPDSILSKEERATLLSSLRSSIGTLMQTHRDSHLIRAQYLSLKNEIPTILREYQTASLYENLASSILSEAPSQRDTIRTNCYRALIQGYAKLTTPPDEREFRHTSELLGELFPIGESKLVFHEALQVIRGNLLSQDPSTERSVKLAHIQGYSDTLLQSAIKEQSLHNLPKDGPFLGSESEKITALKTLLLEVQEVCERREFKKLSSLDASISHLLRSNDDEGLHQALQASVVCQLSEYILRFKEMRESLTTTLSECDLRISTSNSVSKNTQALLLRLAQFDPSIFQSKKSDFIQQQFYATTAASINVARHSALSYSVLHATSEEEKISSFSTLKELYNSTQKEEFEQLVECTLERDALAQRKISTDSLQSPVLLRTTQGKILTLNSAISRLSRSIVANAVELSTLALQARNPMLSKEAREIIKEIPHVALRTREGKELLDRFSTHHHSDSALLSALREFLEQSVKDNSIQTLGIMIAFGLLGAGMATERNRGKMFLIGSSLAMAAIKTYCVTSGFPMIQEAFASQLTYATPLTSSLDALYLFTDVAQASLLLAALRNLRRSEASPEKSQKGSILTLTKEEMYHFSRLAISQLDPRSLGFYLIGTPISVGAYQILTSGLRTEEQMHQFTQLACEVIPILLAALIHDRTKVRLDGAPPSETTRIKDDGLPPLPKVND